MQADRAPYVGPGAMHERFPDAGACELKAPPARELIKKLRLASSSLDVEIGIELQNSAGPGVSGGARPPGRGSLASAEESY